MPQKTRFLLNYLSLSSPLPIFGLLFQSDVTFFSENKALTKEKQRFNKRSLIVICREHEQAAVKPQQWDADLTGIDKQVSPKC